IASRSGGLFPRSGMPFHHSARFRSRFNMGFSESLLVGYFGLRCSSTAKLALSAVRGAILCTFRTIGPRFSFEELWELPATEVLRLMVSNSPASAFRGCGRQRGKEAIRLDVRVADCPKCGSPARPAGNTAYCPMCGWNRLAAAEERGEEERDVSESSALTSPLSPSQKPRHAFEPLIGS